MKTFTDSIQKKLIEIESLNTDNVKRLSDIIKEIGNEVSENDSYCDSVVNAILEATDKAGFGTNLGMKGVEGSPIFALVADEQRARNVKPRSIEEVNSLLYAIENLSGEYYDYETMLNIAYTMGTGLERWNVCLGDMQDAVALSANRAGFKKDIDDDDDELPMEIEVYIQVCRGGQGEKNAMEE